MKKTNLKLDDKVMTIRDGRRRYGNIRALFDNLNSPVAMVDFENENGDTTMEKVRLADLVLVEEPEVKETATPSEPVEKSEITLTPDEFRAAAISVLVNITTRNANETPDTLSVLVALHKALFFTDVSSIEKDDCNI